MRDYNPHPFDGIWYILKNELNDTAQCVFRSPQQHAVIFGTSTSLLTVLSEQLKSVGE